MSGYYVSQIAVPENTTLIFYGPDAEALFRVMEPSLASEPLSAGGECVDPAGRDAQGSCDGEAGSDGELRFGFQEGWLLDDEDVVAGVEGGAA